MTTPAQSVAAKAQDALDAISAFDRQAAREAAATVGEALGTAAVEQTLPPQMAAGEPPEPHDHLRGLCPTCRVPLPRIRGCEVTLADGQTYVVPPLKLRHYLALKERLLAMMEQGNPLEESSGLTTLQEATYLCLERNYPGRFTVDDMLDLIDFGAVSALLAAFYKQHGLTRGRAPSGEAPRADGAAR